MVSRPILGAGLTTAIVLSGAAIAQPNPTPVAAVGAVSDRECLARAMYFESEKSAEDGMLAVGTVVANRLKSGRYGSSMCGVVAQRGQFAPGVMSRRMEGQAAERARQVAAAVLRGHRHPGAKGAMFFHTAGLKFRYPNMHYVLVSGGNIFYEKRSARDAAAQRANALSMARATVAAKADQAAVKPIVTAAMTGAPAAGSSKRFSAYDMFSSSQQQPALGYAASDSRAQTARGAPRTAFDTVASIEPKSAPLPPSRPMVVEAKATIVVLPPKRPSIEPQLASLGKPVPMPRPRVITPAAPVQAAMGPVAATSAPTLASFAPVSLKTPRANVVVAMAWAAFD